MKNFLSIEWTTSKARETYGWNVCTLKDPITGKKYKTNGGGYDMIGTVFALWLKDNYMKRIIEEVKPEGKEGGVYGLFQMNDHYWIDGACGLECMLTIVEKIGIKADYLYVEGKGKIGFFIEDTRKKNLI